MRTILNVIWLLFGGIWLALGYFLVGILACVLIVTIPVGVAAFRMGSFALWPFGKTVVNRPGSGVGSALMNVIWFVIGGLPLAVGHLTTAAAQAITIVGIPLAIANVKMIPVTCFPCGKQIVDSRSIPAGTTPVFSL